MMPVAAAAHAPRIFEPSPRYEAWWEGIQETMVTSAMPMITEALMRLARHTTIKMPPMMPSHIVGERMRPSAGVAEQKSGMCRGRARRCP